MMTERHPAIDRWDTCGHAWIALLRHVWTTGEAGLDDRSPIIEAPPCLFEIASLSWDDPILAAYARRGGARAGSGSGGGPPGGKDPLAPRLRELQGVDQLGWVLEVLRARPWSGRGWISLTVPGEDPAALPELTALSFRIVTYRLVMTAVFRAQNAMTSHLGYLPLRAVQAEVADGLGLPAGPLRVFVDLPLIYLADAEAVATILTAA